VKTVLCRELIRRIPFQLEKLPWILKVYRYPFDRWSTVGRQGLFGVHNFLLFYLYKRFFPVTIGGTFLYTFNGQPKRIRFNPKNTQFHALYFKACSMGYEPQLSALIDVITPDKGVFYDVGSNWGWFSLMLASRAGYQGRIHAFEPFPSTFKDLTSVVEQAGVGQYVQCHNVALLDRAGAASIYLPDHIHSGNATVAVEGKSGNAAIQTATLDSFSAEPPDVIKIDVEGAELQVFIGGKEMLQKHKPLILFENRREPENVERTMQPILFLEKMGYVFYHIAWLRTLGKSPCLIGDDIDPAPQQNETLALVPFQSSQRFLLHDLMNIVGCHQDKAGLLENYFEKRQI
jgi:FkbM family methyltransferase